MRLKELAPSFSLFLFLYGEHYFPIIRALQSTFAHSLPPACRSRLADPGLPIHIKYVYRVVFHLHLQPHRQLNGRQTHLPVGQGDGRGDVSVQ